VAYIAPLVRIMKFWGTQTRLIAAFAMLASAVLLAASMAQHSSVADRQRMVEEIDKIVALTASTSGAARLDPRVRAAMAEVPRDEFVPPQQRSAAYEDQPVSIGHGQTISQPFIVALMTELLQPKAADRILEVGTGSGYQAAILSLLAREIYTVEIVPALGETARATLERLGYTNVRTRIGDGYNGWPEHAPFDAIIVTAAPDHIPPALIAQLKPGGRMIIPVGGPFVQELTVLTKRADGTISTKTVEFVRFVPLIRE
jgi:protein-L-isoaspartate(D-aspartate) O-methyltransferase